MSTPTRPAGRDGADPAAPGRARPGLLGRPAVAALLRRPPLRSAATAPLVAGGALIAATAAIHLHLWLSGYRFVPTLGDLFMAQAVTGFVLGLALVADRRPVLAVVGAGYMAASAIGLILSDTVGFVGIHDTFSVPWATPALVVELVGLAVTATTAAVVMMAAAGRVRGRVRGRVAGPGGGSGRGAA